MGGDDDGRLVALERQVAALVAEVAALRVRLDATDTPTEAPLAEPEVWARLGLEEGERRTVTVLFADVSGFTALSEAMDPEAVQLVMREVLGTLAGCVARHGGTVEKFIGDAVCALFGAPVAYPDEPHRAARAALEMHAALVARAAAHPDDPPLGIHAGINTGIVVAGGVGDGSQFGVMGDTINTAARLMDLAVDGETVVSAATARRLRRDFVLVDRGDHEVKGKARPVTAFAVERPLTPVERAGVRGLRAPLIGRDAELARLRELGRRTAAGDGIVVAVVGEEGTGTTRLCDELLAVLAEADGFRPLRASARALADTPLGLVAGALGPLVADLPGGPERTQLESVLAEGITAPHDFELSLGRVLVAAAREAPVVVLLDDADDADPGSVEVVRYLARVTAREAVLWLVTGERIPPAFQGLLGTEDVSLVHLAPLADAAAGDLLEALLPGALPADVRTRLAALCDGNPEFVEELALSLVDGDVVVERDDGRWELVGDPDAVGLPDSVSDLVEARVEGLPTAARLALQEASVIGVVFGAGLLREITSLEGGVDAPLSELVGAELLAPPEPGTDRWRFRSRLVRDVAYESVLRRRRRALHRAVADALVRLEPERAPDNADLLAVHLELSDDPALAVAPLLVALDRAERAHNASGAVDRARRGLRLHDRHPERVAPGDAVTLLRRLGTNLLLLGDPTGLATLEQAVEALERVGDTAERAELAERVGWYLVVSGAVEPGTAHLHRAGELAGTLPEGSARAGVLAAVDTTAAFARGAAGEPGAGLADVAGAAERARAAGDAFTSVRARAVAGVLQLWEGRAHDAVDALRAALDECWVQEADLTAPGSAAFGTLADRCGRWLVAALVEAGRYAEASELAHPLMARADDRGDPSVAVGVRAALSQLHRHLGDPVRAVDLAAEAVGTAAGRVVAPDALGEAHLALAEAAVDLAGDGTVADPAAIEPAVVEALDLVEVRLAALDDELHDSPWLAWRSRARMELVRARARLLAADPAAALAAVGEARAHLGVAGAARERAVADRLEGLALDDPGRLALALDAALALAVPHQVARAARALVEVAGRHGDDELGAVAAGHLAAAHAALDVERAALDS